MNESIKLTDRPTPETDAEVKRTYQGVGLIHIVNAEYARRLEQQRDAAVEALSLAMTPLQELADLDTGEQPCIASDAGNALRVIRATLAAIKETK